MNGEINTQTEKTILTLKSTNSLDIIPSGHAKIFQVGRQTVKIKNIVSPQQKLSKTTDNNKVFRKSEESNIGASYKPNTNKIDFYTIYKELHNRFPEIINLDKPVLLAKGIAKELSKIAGISGVAMKKWIAKYFRSSNYYDIHKSGAPRYNLENNIAGFVTEQEQIGLNQYLDKAKTRSKK